MHVTNTSALFSLSLSPSLSAACRNFSRAALPCFLPLDGVVVTAPWRAVPPHNVTCQERQLALAAPGILGDLHGPGGSHNPAGANCFDDRVWLLRVEHRKGSERIHFFFGFFGVAVV